MLAEFSETAHLIQFFDSTHLHALTSRRWRKKGGSITRHSAPARRISTKIHLKTDLDGRPLPTST